jgi:spore germination protein
MPSAAAQTATEAPSRLPYDLYAVQVGDSIESVAARYGISVDYLRWANPDLAEGSLAEGQMLLIPAGNGLLRHVRTGETVSAIAAEYGVRAQDIASWPGNGLASADQPLTPGQIVFVPGGVPPAGR